jgi:hypothetical protein
LKKINFDILGINPGNPGNPGNIYFKGFKGFLSNSI